MTEEQLFLAALDLPDTAARDAYLREACGDDAHLRRRVDALLASHFKSGAFLDVPAAEQLDLEANPAHAVTIQSHSMSAERNADDDSESLHFLQPPTRPDSLGRIGHYEVLQVLGKGGFGIVFRAFDDTLQRVVAIKVMAPELAATSPARKRFLREARMSAQVRHENVVQVYEVGEQPLPYLVMEFIPGETLQQRLDRTGPLDVSETLRIGRQIAEGLAAAHATDLIHRDIKPGNILLEGPQHKVKITDFGLARASDDASMTQSGVIAGTPMYMAPEQALGHTVDQRADLFSLGSVLYQMVAGRPPFRANTTLAVLKRVAEDTPRNIREVIPETPQWLCDIITKLHAKNPDERFQSAREMADVLADCEMQLKANSKLRDFSRIPRRTKQPSSKWNWIAAAAALLLPIAVLGLTELTGVTNLIKGSPARETAVQLNALRGKWRVVSGEASGEALSKEFLDAVSISFEDALELKIGDFLKSRTPIVLDGSVSPNTIMGGKGGDFEASWRADADNVQATASNLVQRYYLNGAFRGIYEVEGNQLKLCIAQGGYATPKRFDSRTDDDAQFGALYLVLERPSGDTDGWVQLFNGKDLTGWIEHPWYPGFWNVEDGAIVGAGQGEIAFLYTERGDFDDFHLRAEVQVDSPYGDGGIQFRGSPDSWESYNEVNLGFDPSKPGEQSGSLIVHESKQSGQNWISAPPGLARVNEWMTLEIVARGNHVVTSINGRAAAETRELRGSRSGHLFLQQSYTKIRVRKIEIKELPSSSERTSPPPAVAPFDSAQAGKHQEAWARHLGVPVETSNSLGMKFVLIPPGKFMMGSSDKEIEWLTTEAPDLRENEEWLKDHVRQEGPERTVTISEPFRIGVHEVTVGQFRKFVDEEKYQTVAEKLGGGVLLGDAKSPADRQ